MKKTESSIQPRLMRMRQITQYCGVSRAFLYQQLAEGRFPEGYMLSPGIKAWERSEVDAWLDQRLGKTA